jgi:hypothetical protein
MQLRAAPAFSIYIARDACCRCLFVAAAGSPSAKGLLERAGKALTHADIFSVKLCFETIA